MKEKMIEVRGLCWVTLGIVACVPCDGKPVVNDANPPLKVTIDHLKITFAASDVD